MKAIFIIFTLFFFQNVGAETTDNSLSNEQRESMDYQVYCEDLASQVNVQQRQFYAAVDEEFNSLFNSIRRTEYVGNESDGEDNNPNLFERVRRRLTLRNYVITNDANIYERSIEKTIQKNPELVNEMERGIEEFESNGCRTWNGDCPVTHYPSLDQGVCLSR